MTEIKYIPCKSPEKRHFFIELKKGEHSCDKFNNRRWGQTYKEFVVCERCGVRIE